MALASVAQGLQRRTAQRLIRSRAFARRVPCTYPDGAPADWCERHARDHTMIQALRRSDPNDAASPPGARDVRDARPAGLMTPARPRA